MKQHAGIDVQEMYPAGEPPKADNWTLDKFLKAAETCHKAGYPVRHRARHDADNVDTAGAIFQGYGASWSNARATSRSRATPCKQALDWYKRLKPILPPEAPAWDNASQQQDG